MHVQTAPEARVPIRPSRPSRRSFAVVVAASLLLGACASGGGGDDATAEGTDDAAALAEGTELSVAIASFDLAVGDDQRLLAGVFTPERQLLGFGEVGFQLGYLGEEAGGETEIDQSVTADFLPVPGREPEGDATSPTLIDDPSGQGVYAGQVDFDRAGTWGLRVAAELEDGTVVEGQTTFVVNDEREVVDVGEQAPRSDNATIADVEAGEVEAIAVDSRAQGDDAEIPAPHLHDKTVADSLEAGRPVVVAIATPVYCVSQFCGPLTEVLADIAPAYEDRADVIHLEVWEDFDEQQLNASAAEWIQTEAGGNEPWVFLVDGDGTVLERWDNVLDLDELEAALDELPSIGASTAAVELG
jgi:hypothetical protein